MERIRREGQNFSEVVAPQEEEDIRSVYSKKLCINSTTSRETLAVKHWQKGFKSLQINPKHFLYIMPGQIKVFTTELLMIPDCLLYTSKRHAIHRTM
jgi:hypothetical protein